MTATNHVVTGALIATYVHNPWLAIPIAVASHFALDAIPHYGDTRLHKNSLRFYITLAIDAGLAGSVLLSLLVLQPAGVYLLVACGVAAASPDLMWFYYYMVKNGEGKAHWPVLVRFHGRIQTEARRYLVIELVWLCGAGALLASRLY